MNNKLSVQDVDRCVNEKQNSDSGEMPQTAPSHSQTAIPNYIQLDADRDYVPEGDPWPADVELANALDRYARESGLPLEAQLCPYCPNVGYYAEGPTDAPEQVQCEFCETVPNSLYRIKQAITQLAQSSEQPSTSDVLGNPDRGMSVRNQPESSESVSVHQPDVQGLVREIVNSEFGPSQEVHLAHKLDRVVDRIASALAASPVQHEVSKEQDNAEGK